MQTQHHKKHKTSRWVLMALVGVFVSPVLLAAWILSSSSNLSVFENNAKGQWLSKQFFVANQSHKWIILSLDDKLSHEQKQILHNLHILLGKNRDQVELRWVPSTKFLDEFALDSTLGSETPVFLADPKGMVLMTYRHDQIGKPLLEDIKHLVKHNPR
jgi:hypothetical protein